MPAHPLKIFAGAVLAATLSACSSGGGGGALSPGLTARMDVAGAQLDRAQALGLVNAYRGSVGAAALRSDPGLDAEAQRLALAYASSGQPARRPPGSAALLLSAGYSTFADVFSGWRASGDDARRLATPAGRAGVAVVHRDSSGYGVYWVLLLAP